MEQEYYDLVIKTEFLKTSKVKIKKDIEFYKAAISKLVSRGKYRPLSMISVPSDLHGFDSMDERKDGMGIKWRERRVVLKCVLKMSELDHFLNPNHSISF